jgi:carbon storage regulator
MLVLTRKPGEALVVPGCNITITVVSVRGSRVRLGVVAPPEVAVHREELWNKLRDESSAAAAYPTAPAAQSRSVTMAPTT